MAVVTQSITPSSLRSIGDLLRELRGFAPALLVESTAEIVTLAEQLNAQVKAEFNAGTDKHGVSHDKTGWTLGTFHVEPHPLGAFVVGEGAALLVEDGFRAHQITVSDAKQALHWSDAAGGDHFARTVLNPGYAGDPYVERATDRTDLGDFAARIVGAAYASVFLRATGVHA